MAANTFKSLIERELEVVADPRVLTAIRALMVEPTPVMRGWDYGEPDQQFECWTVLDDTQGSETVIVYCEEGFGPSMPWGLVSAGTDDKGAPASMGMDCGWFPTLLEAFYDSLPATQLPIWRVYEWADDGSTFAISDEGDWGPSWALCEAFQEENPATRYLVDALPRDQMGRLLPREWP
ncbi:hypothetical protein [Caulobacter sp. LARHSG274]